MLNAKLNPQGEGIDNALSELENVLSLAKQLETAISNINLNPAYYRDGVASDKRLQDANDKSRMAVNVEDIRAYAFECIKHVKKQAIDSQ